MPKDLQEAATIRARARGLIAAAKALLAEKTLPASLRKQIEGLGQALRKTWKDLEADAQGDPEPKESGVPGALDEAANMGNWLEARLHSAFTSLADDMFGNGYLTREERISLSAAIGAGLDAFNLAVAENAPQLYTRRPWTEPEPPDDPGALSASEAGQDLEIECVPLIEKAVRGDGTIPVKIIQPGWGSSGFYPAEVLERDGPKVFTKGLKMYWNHPTPTEEAERPERDLRDLSAELVSAARWEPTHQAGPGLYADAKVFEGFKQAVDELAPHIGVSIRARGRAVQGQVEGKTGNIIQEISAARSVDFVTTPGAGGQILQLFEARRGSQAPAAHQVGQPKEATMTEEELKAMKEANAQQATQLQEQAKKIAELTRDGQLREAREFVAMELAKVELPQKARVRLLQTLAANPPLKEGALDREVYTTRIKEAVQAETAYLAEVAGSGQIRGMGSSGGQGTGQAQTPNLEESAKRINAALARVGYGGSNGH